MPDCSLGITNKTPYTLTLVDENLTGFFSTDVVEWTQKAPQTIPPGGGCTVKAHGVFLAQPTVSLNYRIECDITNAEAYIWQGAYIIDPPYATNAYFSPNTNNRFSRDVNGLDVVIHSST